MGVPAFFRWISEKYPKIVRAVIEEQMMVVGTTAVPIDATKPNPNGIEFDNLYLDMNCLIHPCAHPEGQAGPETEEDMYLEIFEYVDRLFNIVRPRKVLYMAIDGVAPRAKMNQQRSRRFRAAQEALEAKEASEQLRREMVAQGHNPPPAKDDQWDHNVITPGTPFMSTLAKRLKHYVLQRQNNNPAWKNIKVVFSDAQAPGEGEHKIMQFIRRERATPGHDPNTHHCLYGLDADLIMLGLATHEVHFTVLRERVLFGKRRHQEAQQVDPVLDGDQKLPKHLKPFDFLQVWVLREYLAHEFRQEAFYSPLPFAYDLERILDDFVFLCFFVGNDFLPHLPSMSIREGGLELLIDLYKRLLPTVGGYLAEDGNVDFTRVEVLMKVLGTVEDEIFKRRRDNDKFMKERRQEQKRRRQEYLDRNRVRPKHVKPKSDRPDVPMGLLVPLGRGAVPKPVKKPVPAPTKNANKEAALALKRSLQAKEDKPKAKKQKVEVDMTKVKIDASKSNIEAFDKKLKELEKERSTDDSVEDKVRLGDEGWKHRYYVSKLGEVNGNDSAYRRKLVAEYIRGLSWVMQYYYKGCSSWKWFFPYHYAPFASDLVDLGTIDLTFAPSEPFSPIDQLMSVLPPASAHALPKPCHWYMTDEDSPIADFYPMDFKYDANGKGVKWLWVALLPFIDEDRLLKVVKEIYPLISSEEMKRNQLLPEFVFIHTSDPAYTEISSKVITATVQQGIKSQTPTTSGDVRHDEADESMLVLASKTNGLSGFFYTLPEELQVPINQNVECVDGALDTVINNQVSCLEFRLPKMKPHLSKLLDGVLMPLPILNDQDRRSRKPRLSKGVDVSDLIGEREASSHSQSGLNREGYSGGQRSWGSMEPKANVKRWHRQPQQPVQQQYIHPSYANPSNVYSSYNSHPAPNMNSMAAPQNSFYQTNNYYGAPQTHNTNPYAQHQYAQHPAQQYGYQHMQQQPPAYNAPAQNQMRLPTYPPARPPIASNIRPQAAPFVPRAAAGTTPARPVSLLDQIQACLTKAAKKTS